jgi:hypothetical protein
LDPKCEEGPCNVTLRIPLRTSPDVQGKLLRDATEYDGEIQHASLGTCNGQDNPPNDTAVISLRLTRARVRVVDGEWVAVRFKGSYREHFPARASCSVGFLEADLKGYKKAP